MSRRDLDDIIPTRAIHVGEILRDELKAMGMSQKELSALMGIQANILNEIIKGKRSLNADYATLIEKAIGLPAKTLMRIQADYEIDCVRISEKNVKRLKCIEIWKILKENLNMSFLRKAAGFAGDVIRDVENIFKIFDVHTIDEFLEKKAKELDRAYYKKSEKLTSDANDIFTWKHYCYFLSKEQHKSLPEFDKEQVGDLVNELKIIFWENQETNARLKETFEKYGIQFLVVEKLGKVPVDGLSFWAGDNPTIVVTERMKRIDNLAFSTMHELGHVVLHLNKDTAPILSIAEDNSDQIENEANQFAMDSFVSPKEWDAFYKFVESQKSAYLYQKIKEEAEKLQVHPQILYGRYMHQKSSYKLPRFFETTIN